MGTPQSDHDDHVAAIVREPEGYFAWLLSEGTDRVTVHHLAELGRKRVRDVEFLLSCEGVPVDYETRTVKIRDLLEAGLV